MFPLERIKIVMGDTDIVHGIRNMGSLSTRFLARL